MYLWRAVDDEGEVLGTAVERRRDAKAATSFLQKLLRDQPVTPEVLVTDGLKLYLSAVEALGLQALHSPGRLRENNRVENSHLPIRKRERHMQQFKSQGSAQRFLTVHAAVYNTFYVQRHVASRPTMKVLRTRAHQAWREAVA